MIYFKEFQKMFFLILRATCRKRILEKRRKKENSFSEIFIISINEEKVKIYSTFEN